MLLLKLDRESSYTILCICIYFDGTLNNFSRNLEILSVNLLPTSLTMQSLNEISLKISLLLIKTWIFKWGFKKCGFLKTHFNKSCFLLKNKESEFLSAVLKSVVYREIGPNSSKMIMYLYLNITFYLWLVWQKNCKALCFKTLMCEGYKWVLVSPHFLPTLPPRPHIGGLWAIMTFSLVQHMYPTNTHLYTLHS